MTTTMLCRRISHLLPSELRLRTVERRIDRHYLPLIAKARGHDREALESGHMNERLMVSEERDEVRMARLWRLARKYRTVVIPEITARGDAWEDDNWVRGSNYGMWSLKRHAEAAVWLQIDEARKRRREAVESWVKTVATMIPWVVALFSLALAGRLAGLLKSN